MKTAFFRIILAVLAAFGFVSCTNTPPVSASGVLPGVGAFRLSTGGGHPMRRMGPGPGYGPGRGPMSREEFFAARQGGEFSGGRKEVVQKGPGEYQKTTWQNGVNRHHTRITCEISSFMGSMDNAEKLKWSKVVADWANEQSTVPTNEEATTHLMSLLNDGRKVRVRLSSSDQGSEFVSQERTVVSREKVEREDVPAEDAAELQRKAIEQFRQTGENKIVTTGKYHE